MKFVDFCFFLERLESISGRLEITDVLVDLLKKLDVKESSEAVYLILGGLAPKFKKIDFNLAEKQVMKAIARESEMDLLKINNLYKTVGDLGELVSQIKKTKESSLKSVLDVFLCLKKIALEEGFGSQERKLASLSELLSSVGVLEARFIVRIVLSKLRLGFSDKTVLDAVSVMESGDKSHRKKLDYIFQILPDVGKLVKEIKIKGFEEAVRGIKPEVGIPVWSELCQRLNTSEEIIQKMGEVAVEPKFDGTRVQIHYKEGKISTFTRNLDENSHMFPELLNMGKFVNAKDLILDCEAVGINKDTGEILPFQMTITRKRKHGVKSVACDIPLRFYVFDILYKDGVSLIDESYEERRKVLSFAIKKNDILVVDDFVKTDSVDEVHRLHENFLAEGLEGAVIKKWNGKYLPGRQGWNWVKIKESEGMSGKLADTLDLVVMGYFAGKGKRAEFGIGKILVGVRTANKIMSLTKVGTGFTEMKLVELKERLDGLGLESKPKDYVVDKNLLPDLWVKPKQVVEIAADEITKSPIHSSGYSLRFPKFIRFRDDKDINGATDLHEIKEMVRIMS
jgi:DNA ligase 1